MNQLNQFAEVLQNQYVSGVLLIFLILYGGMAKPDLPAPIMNLFSNAFFRVFVLFLIAFVATKNVQVALMVAVAFTVTMNLVSEKKMAEGFVTYA